MNANDLRAVLGREIPVNDAQAQRAICMAFRALRDFLRANVATGLAGWLLARLFPGTAKGIQAVADLLDQYLTEHCR